MASSERQKQYLRLMGVQPWELRQRPPAVEPVPDAVDMDAVTGAFAPSVMKAEAVEMEAVATEVMDVEKAKVCEPQSNVSIDSMDWAPLKETVARCRRCELHRTRTQTVFGTGNERAQWMVVGEAPGADEDRQGEPFVGRAGQLLNNMLLAIGLRREEVYIANTLKCRPPNNRDPNPEEVAHCEAFLHRQVALIRPKIILAVGRVAAHNLLKTDAALANLRQRTFHYAQTPIPLVVTYHPAYLLRSPREKRKAWQDLLYAVSVFRQTGVVEIAV